MSGNKIYYGDAHECCFLQLLQHWQLHGRLLSRLSCRSRLCQQQCRRALAPPAHLQRGRQQHSNSHIHCKQSWLKALSQLCCVMHKELELAVVQEQAALAAEGHLT